MKAPRQNFFLVIFTAAMLSSSPLARASPNWTIPERNEAADILGEGLVRAALKRRFDAARVPYTERSLAAAYGGFGRSLLVDIAARPSQESKLGDEALLIVAAPLSMAPRQADAPLDYGVLAAAALAEILVRDGAPVRTLVAFLADEAARLREADRESGEEGAAAKKEEGGLIGLRDVLSLVDAEERAAVLYLDLPDNGATPALLMGSGGQLVPRELAATAEKAFAQRGLQIRSVTDYLELYRLGLALDHSALAFLNQNDYQALLFQSDRRPSPPEKPKPEDFAEALSLFANLLPTADNEWGRIYANIPLGFGVLSLSEGLIVFLFILSVGFSVSALLVYSLIHRRTMKARLLSFIRRSWALPIYFLLLMLCFIAAGHLLEWLLSLSGEKLSSDSGALAALRLALAGTAYILFSPLLFRKPFPRRAHFYGASAVLLLSTGMIAAAAIDLSFVPAFLWASLFALAAAATRLRFVTHLFAFASPIQLMAAALSASVSGNSTLVALLLSRSWGIAAAVAFVALPYFLLFRRILSLSRGRRGRSAETWYARLVWAAAVIALSAVILRNYKEPAPEKRVYERLNAETAAAKLNGESVFTIELDETIFLDRQALRIRLDAAGRPERFALTLLFDSPTAIYDSPVPYHYNADRRSASLSLGERPPLPLTLELILPANVTGSLSAEALYLDAPWPRVKTEGEYLLSVTSKSAFGRAR